MIVKFDWDPRALNIWYLLSLEEDRKAVLADSSIGVMGVVFQKPYQCESHCKPGDLPDKTVHAHGREDSWVSQE